MNLNEARAIAALSRFESAWENVEPPCLPDPKKRRHFNIHLSGGRGEDFWSDTVREVFNEKELNEFIDSLGCDYEIEEVQNDD